ncbi:MAG: VOC family protein [Pseudomonadota bacterium]
MSEPVAIGACSPFLIVSDLPGSVRHYRDLLGFELRYGATEGDPFFAILGRGAAQIMLKCIGAEVLPQPNPSRHAWAPWDIFIYCDDPDALAREIGARPGAPTLALTDREDGLRGFEMADPDGYVLFFGRPNPDGSDAKA